MNGRGQKRDFRPYVVRALHVFLPLFAGGLVYLLWRPLDLIMFHWIERVGLGDFVARLRELAEPIGRSLPDLFVYCLPNALWLYSFVLAVGSIWSTEPRERGRWLWVPIVLGIGPEFGQLIGWVPGTFDVLDLLTSVAAVAAALIVVEAGGAARRGIGSELPEGVGR